jgi:hypothetical protein
MKRESRPGSGQASLRGRYSWLASNGCNWLGPRSSRPLLHRSYARQCMVALSSFSGDGISGGVVYLVVDDQLEHPQDVVGIVLVDPATEDRLFTMQGSSCCTRRTLTELPSCGRIRCRPRNTPFLAFDRYAGNPRCVYGCEAKAPVFVATVRPIRSSQKIACTLMAFEIIPAGNESSACEPSSLSL